LTVVKGHALSVWPPLVVWEHPRVCSVHVSYDGIGHACLRLIDPYAAYGTRSYAVKWDYRYEGILMLQYES
jgi:hypothetical protein